MSSFGYCLNASTIRGTLIARQIEVAAQAGYGAIELWFADVDAHVATGGTIAGLRQMLDARGLAVPTVIYLGGWFEATDADWPRKKAECAERLLQAAQLGAPRVIACPALGRADVAHGARHYRELLELPGARAAMEFLGFVEQYNTIESALEVVEQAGHPDGTVVIDTFHIFRGGGSVEGLAKLRGDQVAVAHFNDAPPQPPREQQHDADRVWPGAGHLDLRRYLALLRQIDFRGWLSLELFREDLWARDPLEVARTGLEKMRAAVKLDRARPRRENVVMSTHTLVQLALDFPTIEEALTAAEAGVRAGVDILEAGTPLIVAQGAKAIGALAQAFPKMPILADYKTMDSGFKNVQITQRERGHYMTVCANAADETVQSAINEGKKTGIKVVTDTIGVKDQVARARQCVEWGIDMIYLHFAADQRRANPQGDGVGWVAAVCEVAGDVPVGLGVFGVDDAVRGVRSGASLVAIGHPIFNEPDYPGALAAFVEKVKAAR